MKKITLLCALLLAFTANAALAAYATSDTSGALTVGSTVTGSVKLSKSVYMEYGADTTTNGLGYVVGTYHSSGTRSFGSSSGDSKIWYQEGTGVATPTTVPTGTQSADFSGWTAL